MRTYILPPPIRRRRRRFIPSKLGTLGAGTAVFVSSGPGAAGIVVQASEASGGTGPYTHQWEVSDNGGAFTNATNGSGVSGATTLFLTFADTTAQVGHIYDFRLKYTDSLAAVVRSNVVRAQVYTGGTLGAAGGGLIGKSALVG